MSGPSLFESESLPLPERMRPRTLDEFVGQRQLLGPGQALGEAIRRGDLGSTIFWGPPGVGKTTLARLIAGHTGREFVAFSAVTEGVPSARDHPRGGAAPDDGTRHHPLLRRDSSVQSGSAGCLSAARGAVRSP